MKKFKKFASLALILAFTLCVFYGNGNSALASKKENVTIKFAYWGSPFEKQTMEKALKNFSKKYDWITVTPMFIPSDYTAKMTTMIAGNVAPDMGYISDSTILQWGEEGKFLNLNDFFAKDKSIKKSDILSTAFYNVSADNCAAISTATEGFALMYNKDMFKKAGVELPPTKVEKAWNWDKFVEVCKKLTIDKNGKNALDPAFDSKQIKQYGFQFDNYLGVYMSAIVSNGANWLSKDGKSLGLTDPKAIEALQKYADLINVYHVAPSPIQMKSIPDTSIALATGKIAMTFGGNWSLLDLQQQKLNLGIGVLPKLAGSKTLILSGATAIFKTTKHPEEAWLLYKYLLNPESSLELHSSGLWMPVLKSWYTNPTLLAKWAIGNKAHPAGYVDAMVNQVLKNGVQSPAYTVKNFGKMRAIVDPALDKVLLGEQSAKDAMNGIVDQVKPLISGYYGK